MWSWKISDPHVISIATSHRRSVPVQGYRKIFSVFGTMSYSTQVTSWLKVGR